MTFVDRSGGVAAIMGTAGVMLKLRKNMTTASKPSTLSPEWKEKTKERIAQGVEREAGDPVPLNPIKHHKMK